MDLLDEGTVVIDVRRSSDTIVAHVGTPRPARQMVGGKPTEVIHWKNERDLSWGPDDQINVIRGVGPRGLP
jgi:hypothetical protein